MGRLGSAGRSSQWSFGGASGKTDLDLTQVAGTCVPSPLGPSLSPGSVGLKIEGVSGSPGRLVKTPIAEPHPLSFRGSLGRVKEFCIPNSSQVMFLWRQPL